MVTNACHATAARAGESDGSYKPTVWLRTEGSEDGVRVTIRDNGTGIPSEIVDRIFDPFFTTKSGTQGTGLGLSISHEIVREHGGEFQVETEVGEFTEFRILLPRKGSFPGLMLPEGCRCSGLPNHPVSPPSGFAAIRSGSRPPCGCRRSPTLSAR